jgi:hypothetical protein
MKNVHQERREAASECRKPRVSDASFDNSDEDDDEDDVVVMEDVVRRGRGRPRKGEKVIKTNSAKKKARETKRRRQCFHSSKLRTLQRGPS